MSTDLLADTYPAHGSLLVDSEPEAHGSPARVARIMWLVRHLVLRELQSAPRVTRLGWLWPLCRQLAQLAVLVFLFSQVFRTGIHDFPLYVFAGLLLWSWFQGGVLSATSSLLDQRHLLFTPRFPASVIPLAAMSVPLIDTLMALPVLVVMIAATGDLHVTLLLVPVVLFVLYFLIAGVSLGCSALNVYYRDVFNIVGVALLLLFYLTPVVSGLHNVPSQFRLLLRINPMTAMLDMMRDVALNGTAPALHDIAIGVGSAAVIFALGCWVFIRMSPDFVDEL